MHPYASAESTYTSLDNAVEGQSPRTRQGAVADNLLTDEVLLRICRVPESNPQVTPEWIQKLHLVTRLVGRARQVSQLEPALALLASLLGQLGHLNPTHLPFGYHGPRLQSRDWIDRETLEGAAKQIVGLMRDHADADTVATTVQRAVSEAIRLGFMEQRAYDAWRPGMPSGSGWRSMITATPYGVMKAFAATASCGDAGREDGSVQGAERSQPEVVGVTAADPVVELGRRGTPCRVRGKVKHPLTDAQYAVVSALIEAGDEGMNKDGLEAVRPSARRILKKLREDADWAEVILMPGQTNGRYHIRADVHLRPHLSTAGVHQ